jgi:hypothetical protein
MLLPEHGSDIALCDPSQWERRRSRLWSWRRLARRLQMSVRRRPASQDPEIRMAQMLATLVGGRDADYSDDPALLPRLEAHLAITDDVELRKVFVNYLCEP